MVVTQPLEHMIMYTNCSLHASLHIALELVMVNYFVDYTKV